MVYYAWAIIGDVLALLLCPYALIRGGFAERSAAAVIGIGWILTFLVQSAAPGLNLAIILVDLVALVLLTLISIRARKIWTLVAAAFQFNAVAVDIISHFFPQVGVVSIITFVEFWGGYGLLAALGAGVLSVELERRKTKVSPAPVAR